MLMVLGAFALVIGPWLAVMPLTLLGVVLHLSATVWLLLVTLRLPGATGGATPATYA